MSDPTRIHAINQQDAPRWGVLIRVQVPGSGDGVLALPSRINSEEEAARFVATILAKLTTMAEIGPSYSDPFNQEEADFLRAVLMVGQSTLESCLTWKVERTFTPAELQQLMDETATYRRARKADLS